VIEQILQADRHLQVDQVDRARDIYQRVVDMDPGNAIAVVGLARCALADGDDRKAYELASQALEIDPENDMARRMENRLSEILISRGEHVDRPAAAATPAPLEMRAVITEAADTDVDPAAGPGAGTETLPPEAAAETEAAGAPPDDPPTDPGTSPALTTADVATPAPVNHSRPRPITTPPPAAKERPVRKTLFDRLMGR